MPTAPTYRFPKTTDEGEFEKLAVDVLTRRTRARLALHGRRGQRQHGVDAFGPFDSDPEKVLGVQIKNVTSLSIRQIAAEVALAETFRPTLALFCVAASLDRDGALQRDVLELHQERTTSGKFGVEVVFWQDIEGELGRHADLIAKYYPAMAPPNDHERHQREVASRALALVRLANYEGRKASTPSVFITITIRLQDELDFEAAYSLMGDRRVLSSEVNELDRTVHITVNRTSFPMALLLSEDREDYP